MPTWTKMSFQNSNSPNMEHLTFFHDHTMVILVSITIMTMYLMATSIKTNKFNRYMMESQEVEMFWTSMPTLMLIFIALPSLKSLYMMEENFNPVMVIKTIGYQWYWGYEYSNLQNLQFNSMLTSSKLMRLTEVSNHLVIPMKTPTQMVITSKDVIHSWSMPSLGVKMDAMPGRLNQSTMMVNRPSLMVGQCSEICGAGHSFMPITMETPQMKTFTKMV